MITHLNLARAPATGDGWYQIAADAAMQLKNEKLVEETRRELPFPDGDLS